MESLSNKFLEFNKDTLYEVRKMYGLHKPGAMEHAIDILDEWVKQQNHFTKKDFSRQYLEKMIINAKGSVERAKERMERACALWTLMPHILDTRDYDLRKIMYEELPFVTHSLLPKLTKDHKRVCITKNCAQSLSATTMSSYTKAMVMGAEYIKRHDYASGYIFVVDFIDCNLFEIVTKVSIQELQFLATYLIDTCGFRLSQLYIICASKVVDIFVKAIKQTLSSKLGQRISILKDRHSLGEVLDKEIVPEEYGGIETPLTKLQEIWVEQMADDKDFLNYIEELNTARIDESKRPSGKLSDEFMGLPGTFRSLSVD